MDIIRPELYQLGTVEHDPFAFQDAGAGLGILGETYRKNAAVMLADI